MENKDWLRRVDWRHGLVVLGIGVAIGLYLFDAMGASSKVGNLVLILPASILGLLLCVLTLGGIVRDARREVNDVHVEAPVEESKGEAESFYDRARPIVMLGLFAIYILLLPVLGMDVGSAIFLAVALLANGERRVVFIIGYSVIFAAASTLLFKSILPYPLHTLLL
ncbi:hypothetical protein CR155_17770 [Pollutimonas nitritireducens]|uniref:DUF1468 domain-containing protein n=1 Tax=Pollutimonas nitritireducens TaxID=2045209 RepID=A0A2N4UC76_9BURK|nr:tripartite tricarboxylate transporter TctB family protein [Pollutimonas nitritireducens]PLC52634.1 hypothetical protein CR155_17770 [Pollutimonas nitritireducens]